MTFMDLMSLQPLPSEQRAEKYMSVRPSFCPDGGFGAAFGGHVYAQAVWAAAQTVGEGMVVHVRIPPSSRDFVSSYFRSHGKGLIVGSRMFMASSHCPDSRIGRMFTKSRIFRRASHIVPAMFL